MICVKKMQSIPSCRHFPHDFQLQKNPVTSLRLDMIPKCWIATFDVQTFPRSMLRYTDSYGEVTSVGEKRHLVPWQQLFVKTCEAPKWRVFQVKTLICG